MMNLRTLLVAEIRFRWISFLLGLIAVAAPVALLVGGVAVIDSFASDTTQRLQDQADQSAATLGDLHATLQQELDGVKAEADTTLAAMEDRTRRLMRDIGFNLYIVHQDTNFGDMFTGFNAVDMPEEYVHRLANAPELNLVRHLVATLMEKTKWEERTVLLVGFLPEVTQPHVGRKPPMGYQVDAGCVILGHELAGEREVGDQVEIRGESFEIAEILSEQGTWEDVMIGLTLDDAQRVLNKPDVVNRILALGCQQCEGVGLAEIRAQLEEVLPETKITEHRSIALARAEQRDLVKQNHLQVIAQMEAAHRRTYAEAQQQEQATLDQLSLGRQGIQNSLEALLAVAAPIVLLGCVLQLIVIQWMNVRQRRSEISLLRAIGRTASTIVTLILSKAFCLGAAGGVVGCLIGAVTASLVASRLDIGSGQFGLEPLTVITVALGAPLVAMMASWLPALWAIKADPASVLTEG